MGQTWYLIAYDHAEKSWLSGREKLTATPKYKYKKMRRDLDQEETKQTPDMNRMRDLKGEIEGAYKEEETYWKERCKNTWLKEGD